MRMDSSSGKSSLRRCEICSGLHAVAHRLSWRCGLFSPFHAGVFGPAAIVPPARRTLPASRPLHILTQPVVACELRGLGAPGGLLGLPLRHQGTVFLLPAPGRRVAAQLTRHGPRVTPEPAADLPHPGALGAQQRAPTGPDTPTPSEAPAVVIPPAISRQNSRCTAREGSGRPGERIGGRKARSAAHCRRAPAGGSGHCFLLVPIAHFRDRGVATTG